MKWCRGRQFPPKRVIFVKVYGNKKAAHSRTAFRLICYSKLIVFYS